MHISSADKKEKPWFLKALKTRRNPFFDKTVRKTGFIHLCDPNTMDQLPNQKCKTAIQRSDCGFERSCDGMSEK